jgi:glycogen operon protein
VSYNDKHNEANGEENRDGHNDNRSWNCGAEGDTEDTYILDLRERQKRNFITLLMLSQGVPMLLGGDEFGRTQKGNNNAYCQDNELSWFDWDLDDRGKLLHKYTQRVIALRRKHPTFRRRKYYQGRLIRGLDVKDLMWFRPDGAEISDEEWNTGWMRTLGVQLAAEETDRVDDTGHPIHDDAFLLLLNANHENVEFKLPPPPGKEGWLITLDTARPELEEEPATGEVTLTARSMMVLRNAL